MRIPPNQTGRGPGIHHQLRLPRWPTETVSSFSPICSAPLSFVRQAMGLGKGKQVEGWVLRA